MHFFDRENKCSICRQRFVTVWPLYLNIQEFANNTSGLINSKKTSTSQPKAADQKITSLKAKKTNITNSNTTQSKAIAPKTISHSVESVADENELPSWLKRRAQQQVNDKSELTPQSAVGNEAGKNKSAVENEAEKNEQQRRRNQRLQSVPERYAVQEEKCAVCRKMFRCDFPSTKFVVGQSVCSAKCIASLNNK